MKTPSPVTAILWDFDGTLVDTRAKNMRVNRRIIEEVTETRDLLLDIDFDDSPPEKESPAEETPDGEAPGGAEPGDQTSPIETLQQRLESRSLAQPPCPS